MVLVFFFQAEDGIRDADVTGVQTCALPISRPHGASRTRLDVGTTGALFRDPRAVSGGDWFQLAVVILPIVLVAVLGAAEVSITRTNRVRAYRFQEEGRRGATSLVKIAENPAPFLNVVLLLVLLSTIGGTTIATSLAVRVFHGAGEIVATLAMTVW